MTYFMDNQSIHSIVELFLFIHSIEHEMAFIVVYHTIVVIY